MNKCRIALPFIDFRAVFDFFCRDCEKCHHCMSFDVLHRELQYHHSDRKLDNAVSFFAFFLCKNTKGSRCPDFLSYPSDFPTSAYCACARQYCILFLMLNNNI